MTTKGDKICLRTLVPDDLEFVFRWENEPEVWRWGDCGAVPEVGSGKNCHNFCRTPPHRFSREEIRQFIENQQFGFYANGQLRLIIEEIRPARPIGMIDLFDYNRAENSAGVGILICGPADRHRGYGREALKLLTGFAVEKLGLKRLFCSVDNENIPSLGLFCSSGFLPEGEFLVRNF